MPNIKIRGDSICNEIALITPPTHGLELYTIYGIKDQGFTFWMVHKTLFYHSYLSSDRLWKKYTNIHCIYFHPDWKEIFQQSKEGTLYFLKETANSHKWHIHSFQIHFSFNC